VKTVLFAWERGHGFGHANRLRCIATQLRPHGLRLIAAVRKPAALASHQDVFAEITAVPAWPVDQLPAGQAPPASSATLSDTLSAAGLADGEAVGRILSAWDKIFGLARPDLVVADFAPLAALAARGRIPLMLVGTGFTVPPAEMPRFPLLHRLVPPAFDEVRTLETVNAAIVKVGFSRLDRLPQLFSGDACLVQTFPLLDPYDTQRVLPVEGHVFAEPPIPRVADAKQVFAYLSDDSNGWTFMLEALIPVAKCLRIHAPSWPNAPLDRLAEAGAQVESTPQPIAGILTGSRLVVHRGGHGLAAEALAAGVPQLVLADHIEHDLYGEAIERAGVGRLVKTYLPDTRLESHAIQSLIDDGAMAARADALGSRLREFTARRDALMNCEAVCMGLLKLNSA
jgi:UDP:flavonoid glycosyltransferase YjiC (YdhE family)